MKKILIVLSFVSASAFAHENPDIKGKCMIVDGVNKVVPCKVSTGGGAGGMYTAYKIGKKEILVEESTMCKNGEATCDTTMGTNPDKLMPAQNYYRAYKTKKVINKPKEKDWYCTRQIKGKLDACVIY
ncbi:hypothetical protein [Acinetobacter brisouii]|uniref:hypothetical protein n=1 Tax=Acinetobacter brisouii TaxID=396323 RepID=UPI0005F76593|nr:hypothetical protein [Acinetobacter brisouii]KJV40993.1 hypothetical protein VH98_01375 [Acinetobacter brisouii]